MAHTVFLLAAGLGTRLRPLTDTRPKALLPMCGVPMLDYALALARRHGHTNVVVNAHHHWQQVAAWAEKNGVALQVELPEILGTGGGLKAALPGLAEVVTILNADILVDLDLGALAQSVPPGGAAMLLRAHPDAATIGPVERDATGHVVRITDVVGAPAIAGTHFTGVHAMHRDAVARIPDGFQCVIRTAYQALVPEGRVQAYLEPHLPWFDVGTPAAYLAANLAVLRGTFPVPLDPWTRGARFGSSWIGPGARVEGTATDSVIGACAVVPEGAELLRTVVWDGVTVVPGRYQDAVLFDGGVLRP